MSPWRQDFEWQGEVQRALGDKWPPGEPLPRCFRHTAVKLAAMVSREKWAEDDLRWHVSVQADGRVPTWEEMAETVHALRPGVPFVIGIPPRSWWVNLHPDVLHAWETRDEGLIEEWKRNARGDKPT